MFAVSTILIALSLLVVFLTICYKYLTETFQYWAKKNVPFLKPKIFFGNIQERVFLRISFPDFILKLYEQVKVHPYAGMFEGKYPRLLIMEPEMIKDVFIRDFDYFTDRGRMAFQTPPMISKMLLFIGGSHWKKVRSLLTPTFTSGKLKAMDSLVIQCAEQMSDNLKSREDPDKEVELKVFFGRYTLDVIATCAFGIQCNSMKDTDSEFVRLMEQFDAMSLFTTFKLFSSIMFLPTSLHKFVKIWLFNRNTAEYMADVIRKTCEYRIKHSERRNDFLQLMIDVAQKEALTNPEHQIMDQSTIISQSILFMVAGFETSSTLLSFAAYELALNPEIQATLREEVKSVLAKYDNVFNYESLQKMDYLEMVLSETLRKHPPVARIDRMCTKNYTLPGTNLEITKGTNVSIPAIGLHYDPKYFPEPEKFDPLRFETDRSPPGYMAFGMGPRNCIGKRFAMLSSKLAIAYLIKDFECVRTEKTLVPYKKKRAGILLKAEGGVYVKLVNL